MKITGIACHVPLLMKILWFVLMLVLAYFGVYLALKNHPMAWLLWFLTVVRFPLAYPDMQIYQTGIEIQRFGFKQFLAWDDLRYIRVGQFNTLIYPKNLPFLVRLLLYHYFVLDFWRTNYQSATDFIRVHYRHVLETKSQRVYDEA